MKRLMACLTLAQSGLAFAESGEMLTVRDKNRVLAGVGFQATVAAAPKLPEVNMRKQIGLCLGASLPPAVMAYVINACRRMDADLNVMAASAGAAAKLLAPYREKLEAAAIDCAMVELDGNPARSLMRYLNANSRVSFVVSGGADDPVQSLIGSGNGRSPFGSTPVPIVVVASEMAS